MTSGHCLFREASTNNMNVLWLYAMLSLGAVKTFAFLFKSAAREIRAGIEAHGQTHGERVRLGLGELGQTLGETLGFRVAIGLSAIAGAMVLSTCLAVGAYGNLRRRGGQNNPHQG